jgi:hypothetical protein
MTDQPQPGDDDHYSQFEGTLTDGLEHLVELSTDPDSLDWDTLDRINTEGWRQNEDPA